MSTIKRIGAALLVLTLSNLPLSEVESATFPARIAIAEEAQDDEREQVQAGLAGLLGSYGIDVQEYHPIVLDVPSWERGFVEAYSYYSKFMPSISYDAGTRLAAEYFLTNHSHTDLSIIDELADNNYICRNNNVDLKEVEEEGQIRTEAVDPEGFTNVQNAIMFFNDYNDLMERGVHTAWLALQENGGGQLNPANFCDPSIMIQDPRDRDLVHTWFESYIRGYDLTKGTFESNEDMQFVYRAFGSLNSERDEVSIQYLQPATRSYARTTLYEWLQAYVEDYMYENYRFTLRDDPEYRIFDVNELENNQRFVLLDPENTKPRLNDCLNELDICINWWLELENSRKNLAIQGLVGEVLGQKVFHLEEVAALESGSAKTLTPTEGNPGK